MIVTIVGGWAICRLEYIGSIVWAAHSCDGNPVCYSRQTEGDFSAPGAVKLHCRKCNAYIEVPKTVRDSDVDNADMQPSWTALRRTK